MGDLTLSEALTDGAFDRLNWQHSGEFDQNFSKKSNARGFARGGMGGFGIDPDITDGNRGKADDVLIPWQEVFTRSACKKRNVDKDFFL